MRICLVVSVVLLAVGMTLAQPSVDFRVNMSVKMLKGTFNAAEDTIFVGGTFNGWGASTDVMTDPDNDSIYTVTLSPDTVGATIQFKYRFHDVSAAPGTFVWESDPNRTYVLPAGASVYEDFFDRDSFYYPQVDIATTFSVNMELERLSGRFHPGTDTVSVNGTFNGWTPKTSILLPNGLNPDLYEGTFVIHAAQGEKINFKFWYTPNNWESVSDRAYTFTAGDAGSGTASFSASFNDGTLDNVLNQACTIKFTVRTQGAISAIDALPFPAINTVHICGSALPLQWPGGGWPTADSNSAIKIYDDGTNGDVVAGDSVFSVALTIPAYTVLSVQYKYGMNFGDNVNNGGGNDNEAGVGDNHVLVLSKFMASAATVDTFGHMGTSRLTNVSAAPPLTFKVNMSVKMLKGNFNPAEDTIFVGGTFNGWGASTDIMTDPDNDSIYTVTLNAANPGDTILFKYRFQDVSNSGVFVWESDPNRTYVIPAGASVYEDFFDRDSFYYPQVDIATTFSVNMELERLSGRFHPGTDTVSVNGTFNGWSPKTSILLPNGLNPDLYEGTFVIHAAQKEKINFKFWYTPNNWESVSDRVYEFTAADAGSGTASFSASFNDGTLNNVLNQACTIKFTVRTQGAISAIDALPFPAINTVHICGSALPLQWPGGGWPTADSNSAIKMYDDGTNGDVVSGDGVFSGNLTIPAYTVLSVQYKYGMNFGDNVNNGGGNDNEAGVGDNHILQMTKNLTSATVVDTFGHMGVSSLQDPTGVKETGKLPTSYGLKQNYPNPFNPTTNIVYQLPQASDVTLIIYNIFGQEVGTLVNQHQQAGEYVADFKANALASGIYYYRLTAGKFVETKKMLFVK